MFEIQRSEDKTSSGEIGLDIRTHFKIAGTNVRGANVIALPSAYASALSAWTKILTLAIVFKLLKIELSYFICVFLMTRRLSWYRNFDLMTLTLKFNLLLKNFNLGHSFQTRSDQIFILYICTPCNKTFHMVPLMKNFNFECYSVVVVARRASLSSDKSYYIILRTLRDTRP